MRQVKITEKITERNTASMEAYLRDISRYDLITAEEEVKLAKRIKAGDIEAREKLVRANLRFVVSVAKMFQGSGLSLSDLINEGNVGLIKAAEKFDETRGFKFISYAVWWIRQSILQAISENSRIIRLPLNQVGLVWKVKQAVTEFQQRNEREPTSEEIAAVMNLPVAKVEDTLGISVRHISVDAPMGTEEEHSLADMIINPDAEEADRYVAHTESLRNDVNDALSLLTLIQQDVLRQFFGLGGKESSGLEDIAAKLNISTERVRQIKAQAIAQLKSTGRSEQLRSYLGI